MIYDLIIVNNQLYIDYILFSVEILYCTVYGMKNAFQKRYTVIYLRKKVRVLKL